MDHYFRWYDMPNSKVWFAIMKLTGQTRQYWKKAEWLMQLRREDPVEAWDEMKEKHRQKYILISVNNY